MGEEIDKVEKCGGNFLNSHIYKFTYYLDMYFLINVDLGIQGTKHLKKFTHNRNWHFIFYKAYIDVLTTTQHAKWHLHN